MDNVAARPALAAVAAAGLQAKFTEKALQVIGEDYVQEWGAWPPAAPQLRAFVWTLQGEYRRARAPYEPAQR